jgi:hypothetical protein
VSNLVRLSTFVIVTWAWVNVAIAQTPKMISELGKLITTISDRGSFYATFEYEGVRFLGDVSVEDYQAAVNRVKPQLTATEHIETVIASQQVPSHRSGGKDLQVRTCSYKCAADAERSAFGRVFVFEREAGQLQLFAVFHWME